MTRERERESCFVAVCGAALLWLTRTDWALVAVIAGLFTHAAWRGAEWIAGSLGKASRYGLAAIASAGLAGLFVATQSLAGERIILARTAASVTLVMLFWRAALWEILPNGRRRHGARPL
jgi:hypothetical protein